MAIQMQVVQLGIEVSKASTAWRSRHCWSWTGFKLLSQVVDFLSEISRLLGVVDDECLLFVAKTIDGYGGIAKLVKQVLPILFLKFELYLRLGKLVLDGLEVVLEVLFFDLEIFGMSLLSLTRCKAILCQCWGLE